MSFGTFNSANLPNLPNNATAIRKVGVVASGVSERLTVTATPCMAVLLRAPGAVTAAPATGNARPIYWTIDQSRLGLDCRGSKSGVGNGSQLLPGESVLVGVGDASRVIIDMDNNTDVVIAQAFRVTP